jgi:hypothetical protein
MTTWPMRANAMVMFCALALACSRAQPRPPLILPDAAARKELLKREATCAAPTRVSPFPLITMSLKEPPPDPSSKPAPTFREPPAALEEQREPLAQCLQPGERLALRLEPNDGHPKIEPICQYGRPEALNCVQERVRPVAAEGVLAFTLSANEPPLGEGKAIGIPLPDLQACYNGLLSLYPQTQGEVLIGIIVGPDGLLKASDILANTTGVFELACCVENRLSMWKFPPGNCTSHIVKIPFVLR